MKSVFFAASFILLLMLACVSFAEDISVSASVDKKIIPLRDALTLVVQIQGTQSARAPELPRISGVEVQYVGPSTQVSVVNGKSSVSVAHRYSLMAFRTGEYTIPSLSVEYKYKTYKTEPIKIKVVSRSELGQTKTMTKEELGNHCAAISIKHIKRAVI